MVANAAPTRAPDSGCDHCAELEEIRARLSSYCDTLFNDNERLEAVAQAATFRLLAAIQASDLRPRPGVYALLDADGEPIYIGQSKNVLNRLSGHRDKEFSYARMIEVVDPAERDRLERDLIALLTPDLNVARIDDWPTWAEWRSRGAVMARSLSVVEGGR